MVLLKASTFASSVVLAALAYTACGPAKDAGSNVDGLYGGASGRGAAGSSNGFAGVGGSGLGGNAGSGIAGVGIAIDSGSLPDDAGGEAKCGATTVETKHVTVDETVTEEIKERAPADVFIMFDKSESMNAQEGGQTRWAAVTQATIGFVQSMDSAGLGVGIQFFGRQAGVEDCTVQTYSQPQVPIALLPGNANALVQAINGQRPSSETPTTAALTGALNYAKQWKSQNPMHPVFVLLVTDGEPGVVASVWNPISTCVGSVQDVPSTVAAADAGFKGNPPIQTFVLGVGPSLNNLDQIAVAGGTQKAYLISGNNVAQQVIDALNNIRGTISKTITKTVTKTRPVPLECEWVMPAPAANQKQDPNKVNVNMVAGGNTTQLGMVPSQADCATHTNAWYYDNPSAPTKLIACPATCDAIKGATEPRIDIFVGCNTIIAPPL